MTCLTELKRIAKGHFSSKLGPIMAAQLLLGRYTGYRLNELLRFRDFLGSKAGARPSQEPHKLPAPHFLQKSKATRDGHP